MIDAQKLVSILNSLPDATRIDIDLEVGELVIYQNDDRIGYIDMEHWRYHQYGAKITT